MKRLIGILLFFPMVASAAVEINFWHAMESDLGASLEKLVGRFNSSQNLYHVNPIFKGNYTETLNSAIAAYRGKKQPHIVQVFEVGTMTMMSSGAIVPVQDLMKDQGQQMNWADFVQPVLSYYKDAGGKLMSMPFNSSSPIMFYNKDLFQKAGIKNPPKTWAEIYKDADILVKAGAQCGLAVGWQPWVLIENFSAIHNIPFATLDNGYAGKNPKLVFNNPAVIANVERLQKMLSSKAFSYEGRRSDGRVSFISGKCGIYMDSSSQISTIKSGTKFKWAAAPLPVPEKGPAQNGIIGGATLWVFKGFKPDENKGVAEFIKYLGTPESQVEWHKATGYLPITVTAYKNLKTDGYYQQNPEQEVAIQQLLRTKPNTNSRGLRIGGFTQVREIADEELENVWAGKKSAKAALDSAVERGNKVVESFSRTIQ